MATAENLKSAFTGESQANRGAEVSFKNAMAVEQIHHGLYGEALASAQSGKDLPPADIHICDVCGNTVVGDVPDRCPICGASRNRFRKVD